MTDSKRFWTAIALASLFVTVDVAWMRVRSGGSFATTPLGDVSQLVVTAIVAAVCWWAGRRSVGAGRRALEETVEERTAELGLSEQRLRALVETSSDVVSVIDDMGFLRFVSDSVERVLGHRADALVGSALLDGVHEADRPKLAAALTQLAGRPGTEMVVAFRLRHRDRGWRFTESTMRNLLDDPAVRGIVLNTRDVSEHRALEDELTHQAFHDPITGLPNRALFLDRTDRALQRAALVGGETWALCLNVDGFKYVNDTFGHAVGDELLVAVSERVARCVRPADTVARFGADEFGVLVEDGDVEVVETVAARILAALESPFPVADVRLTLAMSIGLASSGGQLHGSGELVRNADVAMSMAKSRGGGRFALFDDSMHEAVLARVEMEVDLRLAVDRQQLFLEYQPVVDLVTGQTVGAEALLRWRHPTRGVVPPLEFVPLAEETGLIVEIGRWVLAEACREARHWVDRHADAGPLVVAVNLSTRQFERPGLVEEVAHALEASGLPPHLLSLEITESLLMGDLEAARAVLLELKALGVSVAIDDFGTGYSSLAYLRRLPIDTIKVDRSFVEGLGKGPEDSALARAVVKLARSLRLRTIAEGVEEPIQLEELRAMGCNCAQGYRFARPLSRRDFEEYLDVSVVDLEGHKEVVGAGT